MTRELVYTGFTTVDGGVDSPGGDAEGHPNGGWGFQAPVSAALMFGRNCYGAFSNFWPTSEDHAAYLDDVVR